MPLLVSLWSFLKLNNFIPYIIIIIMSYIIYYLFTQNIEANLKLDEASINIETAYETMGDIQAYNEERFDSLREIKDTKWKEGKHEKSF